MAAQALAAVAALISFAPHGNRIDLRLDHGAAEMVWVSPSTFRFRRAVAGPLPAVEWKDRAPVELKIDDEPGLVRVRSKFLDVAIQKRGVLVRVRKLDGTALMSDMSEPAAAGDGVVWERQMPAGVRFYGLGPRTDEGFDLRGKAIDANVPFLAATSGYGEYHAGAGRYRFDFSAPDRYRVQGSAVDYFFYYGPGIKQIFEENKEVRGVGASWAAAEGASWEALHGSLLRLVQGAMSASLAPSFSLRVYESADAELVQRARQLGSLVDDVAPGKVGLSGFRQQLEAFFTVYASEAQMKGYPIWHPLPFQFPEDPECARHADEFMLGDEMLIAPIVAPGTKRSVYLPQGMWTNLETNERQPGRRTITVDTKALPVFARNGTIVPLDSGAGMALHYFPTLGAEFFLLESDPEDWTQIHAAPAADIMRLQIESKKARDYQWVVHHVEKPVEVGFEDRKYRQATSLRALTDRSWFYDAEQKSLQVRVHVKAGEDCIVNLSF
jgi:hypothetical protein